ncbi:hypothetical protein N7520_002258 [Penicillium odoratum]|uniref:uncharacterized protein n=1 Tax=Penicillium odoratum TaxID=1167516 RepID=UPI0025481938|nr:uncharacterized protein N7520_002258 [Penicillium odoratum]KAJ5771729.1 hypothetical protein N7520_002258 [Penicillium odoratum]
MIGLSWKLVKSYLPRVRFLTVHYAYFIGVSFVTSAIFWGTSTPANSVRYIDSLFLTISAMTLAGLNTVNLSTLNTFQQILLFFLIMFGSTVRGYFYISRSLISKWQLTPSLLDWKANQLDLVIAVRKRAFEKRFEEIVQEERLRRKTSLSLKSVGRQITWPRPLSQKRTVSMEPDSQADRRRSSASFTLPASENISFRPTRSQTKNQGKISRTNSAHRTQSGLQVDDNHSMARDDPEFSARCETVPDAGSSGEPNDTEATDTHITFPPNLRNGPGETTSSGVRQRMRRPYVNVQSIAATQHQLEEGLYGEHSDLDDTSHLHFLHKFSRNSSFHNLSERERQRLGGAEYRAVSLLSIIVPVYFLLWQLLGGIGVGAYISRNHAALARSNGLNPWWVGFFFAISAFNNSGLSVLDANMIDVHLDHHGSSHPSWQHLVGSFNIILRHFISVLIIFVKLSNILALDIVRYTCASASQRTLTFLLEHPRRCYTTLFPAAHTWWLLMSVIVLNGISWVAYEVLNYDNPAVDIIPVAPRVLDGLFQALCVRSGGFYITNIAALEIGNQVIYVIMMYISVYPFAITMRHSNVYEERSLGIYADDPSLVGDSDTDSSATSSYLSPSLGRMYFLRHQLRSLIAYDIWWIALAVVIISIVEAGQFTRDPLTYSAFNIIFETVSAYGCVGISTGLPNQLYSFSGGWHTLSKLVLCAVMIRGRHRALPVAIDKAIMLPSEKLAKAEEEDALIRIERTMSRTTR